MARIDGPGPQRALVENGVQRIGRPMTEGSKLLLSNLCRAIDLVYSFKQVAADQASGERRRFEVKGWLDDC